MSTQVLEKPQSTLPQLTDKNFKTDQDVRWCPGCGDYSILKQVQKTLPELGVPNENIVFVSGIGCSSRFPHYIESYGLHTIHGRAPAFATALAIVNPELSVWVITGDGDGLSIGGNHFIHLMRRNVNLNIILFNNEVYGLTKGQYSPTSPIGTKGSSTPMGSLDNPINPLQLAIGGGAKFLARAVDTDAKLQRGIFMSAALHGGTSLVEILQNCVIFNDGAFDHIANKKTRDDNQIVLEHGKPLVFGKAKDKGIKIENGYKPVVVDLNEGFSTSDLAVHDETNANLAFMLIGMDKDPHLPVPVGVIHKVDGDTYDDLVRNQLEEAKKRFGKGNLKELIYSAQTWEVN